jgi:hypothetical protein
VFAALIPHGDPGIGAFIVVMLAGFVIGTAGHVVRSKTLIVIGIVLIFAGTVALPLLVFGNGTG